MVDRNRPAVVFCPKRGCRRYALHENIRARRTQLKLSQEYVAEKLGVSRQAVAKWEAGKSEPTAANLARLAALFEMNVSDLAAPPDAAVQKASPRRHNARMLAGRWAAVLLMNAGWDGYSSGLYASMPAYWLAILCTGLVLLLLTSLDMQKRWKLQRLQLAVGAALLFSIFFLPRLPFAANTGLRYLLADLATALCACVLSLKYWRHIWRTR